MKVALVLVLALVCFAAVYAVPAGKDAKEAATKDVKEPKDIKESATATKEVKDAIKANKDAKKNKKECAKDCATIYDPVCAHDASDTTYKPRTFASQCALDVHNCEMGTKLTMKSKGQCPGSGGVRLS